MHPTSSAALVTPRWPIWAWSFSRSQPSCPPEVVAAVDATTMANGRAHACDAMPQGHCGLFVGQVPFGFTQAKLAYAVNLTVGAPVVEQVTVAYNQACGWVCLTVANADLAFAATESSLLEPDGLWLARDGQQRRSLHDFCAQLKNKVYGEAILKQPLPKAAMTFRPVLPDKPKPNRHTLPAPQAAGSAAPHCPDHGAARSRGSTGAVWQTRPALRRSSHQPPSQSLQPPPLLPTPLAAPQNHCFQYQYVQPSLPFIDTRGHPQVHQSHCAVPGFRPTTVPPLPFLSLQPPLLPPQEHFLYSSATTLPFPQNTVAGFPGSSAMPMNLPAPSYFAVPSGSQFMYMTPAGPSFVAQSAQGQSVVMSPRDGLVYGVPAAPSQHASQR
jgi:hypothetical protein